jgi:hypothetical protein
VVCEVRVRHQRADQEAAGRGLLDVPERQARDVDQPRGRRDVVFDQVDQIGAARNEFCGWIGGDLLDGVGEVGCARILKLDHDRSIACWIAATMFG